MAKYLTNIDKSQYYHQNYLNWIAAQCNLQKSPLTVLTMFITYTPANSMHRTHNIYFLEIMSLVNLQYMLKLTWEKNLHGNANT